MSKARITRHFATITTGRWGPRQVHYRRVGSGPVVICFHQSPMSSRDMVATMERWQDHFTCIAPDSPGFGLSDPLGVANADIEDFAEAAVEFMDALGIERAAVYGFHTGAMIAAAIATAFPERIVCAAANGYVILTEAERADIVEHYLPPLLPSWDGSHLSWLWARLREQTIFFPWYRKALADRLAYDVPPATGLHEALLDFMRSGDHYRVGYRAAFTMRSDLALRRCKVPLLISASATDVLGPHLKRIRHTADVVTVKLGEDMDKTFDLCRDFIKRHKPPKAPPIRAPLPLQGRLWNDFIEIPGGQLRIARNDEGKGRAVLIQHDAVGSSDTVAHLASGFIGMRPVIAIDLPGHGESDPIAVNDDVIVSAQAKSIVSAARQLGVKEFDFVGVRGGGLIGLEISLQQPRSLRHLVMIGAPWLEDSVRKELRKRYAPDIQPNWHGGYLLEAWHMLRDQRLFWPWYARSNAAAIGGEPQVDPQDINREVLELFRSKGMWRKSCLAHLSYPLKRSLRAATAKMIFSAPAWDALLANSQLAAKEHPTSSFMMLSDQAEHWARDLLPLLEDER